MDVTFQPVTRIPKVERFLVDQVVGAFFAGNRKAGPWPVPDDLPHEAVIIPGPAGGSLAARWFPAVAPRGTVVLAHPDRRYGQHWFVREGWVHFLHEAGFDVLTFDFPGYGGTPKGSMYYYEHTIAAAHFARRWSGGFPVHLVGLSMGAFAVANASPELDFVESLVLESPYPTIGDWYGRGVARMAFDAMSAMFPTTAGRISAVRNLPRSSARRILVAAPAKDRITSPELSRRVAESGPAGRTQHLEVPACDHLGLFRTSAGYRAAVLETLGLTKAEAARHAAPTLGVNAKAESPAAVAGSDSDPAAPRQASRDALISNAM